MGRASKQAATLMLVPPAISAYNTGMDSREKAYAEISRRMGPDYFNKKPPVVFEFDSYKLQRKAKNEKLFKKLRTIYEQVPPVQCGPCGDVCCRESPDVYLIEYLYIWRHIKLDQKNEQLEAGIARRALEWMFLHYLKPGVYCPFLVDKKCAIYDVRPLNCRLWALEDENHYQVKATRAEQQINTHETFFSENGIEVPLSLKNLVLPKCNNITVEGDKRYSEEEVTDLDLAVAFLHLTLIPHETFRSMNFHLHFPGQIAARLVPPSEFDDLSLRILKEYNEKSESSTLESLVKKLGGMFP